jgi:predicted patatin/cPLA2 family phospholipase
MSTCLYSSNIIDLPEGFSVDNEIKEADKEDIPVMVHTTEELKEYIRQGYPVHELDVRGDTHSIHLHNHPVIKAMRSRLANGSKPGNRDDGMKIAVAIEGGGMRGCVAAGMISAVDDLGLSDTIDVVYGSSAGALVGAYFISRQMPHFGPEVYYDVLTSSGKKFIDMMAIFRCAGLGIFDLRLQSLRRLLSDRMGKPVLNLTFLLHDVINNIKPLDWDSFWKRQVNKEQPLKVVASGLLSKRAVLMSAENGNFHNLEELSNCMRASMSLPGVTGDTARLKESQMNSSELIHKTWWLEYPKWAPRRNRGKKHGRWHRSPEWILGGEPMADAQLFEPIPYRSALQDGCTHILVLRTRADGVTVTKNMGLLERMIMSRFFSRKLKLRGLRLWMTRMHHKLIYAEDLLRLNHCNRELDASIPSKYSAKMLCVALPPGAPEVHPGPGPVRPQPLPSSAINRTVS